MLPHGCGCSTADCATPVLVCSTADCAAWTCLLYRSLRCLDVSVLQLSVLPLDLPVLQQTVLPLDLSVLQQTVLPLYLSVLQQTVLPLPLLCCLNVSVKQLSVLPLNVSVLQQPVCGSRSVCYIANYSVPLQAVLPQDLSVLYWHWTCLLYNNRGCPWTCPLDSSLHLYPRRCLACSSFCCTRTRLSLQEAVLHLFVFCCADPRGCLSTRAYAASVHVLLCWSWRVSVYKSLCCICPCAFVLTLEGVCLQEPMLHLPESFCADSGVCLFVCLREHMLHLSDFLLLLDVSVFSSLK